MQLTATCWQPGIGHLHAHEKLLCLVLGDILVSGDMAEELCYRLFNCAKKTLCPWHHPVPLLEISSTEASLIWLFFSLLAFLSPLPNSEKGFHRRNQVGLVHSWAADGWPHTDRRHLGHQSPGQITTSQFFFRREWGSIPHVKPHQEFVFYIAGNKLIPQLATRSDPPNVTLEQSKLNSWSDRLFFTDDWQKPFL